MINTRTAKSTVLVFTVALLFVCLMPPSSYANDAHCKDISANQSVTANGDGTTDGTITQGGILNGQTHFVTSSFSATSDPTVFFLTGNLTITTNKGTLTTSDVSIFDFANLLFTDIARITGGTGDFSGATGVLFISGKTTDGVHFQDKIIGNICLAD